MSGTEDELAVEEAADRQVCLDRVDVREAGQVADDRADRAAAPAPGRQRVPRRAGAAHLHGDLAGELEHLPVEEEEPGELQLGDQGELLVEPLLAPLRRVLAGSARKNACSQTLRSWPSGVSKPSEKSG